MVIYPPAPDLTDRAVVAAWSDAELYWILKHGIKDTAMMALGPTHKEEDIWRVAAFVRQLPEMTPEQYQAMAQRSKQGAGHQHGDEGADHGATHGKPSEEPKATQQDAPPEPAAPDQQQLEASRLQLEASRLQLEASRKQLEAATGAAPASGRTWPKRFSIANADA